MNTGRIYFIQSGEPADRGPIKVGIAKDPAKRMRDLQIGNPERLRLLGFSDLEVDGFQEGLLHLELAEHRLSGEWFRPHRDLYDVIDRVCLQRTPRPNGAERVQL